MNNITNENLNIRDDLSLKKEEIKSIIENDDEDMNSFLIHKKINLTKEKNENIKNMKKLILDHPDIFVKNSVINRELKKNIEENKILFNDINFNYEKITKLFESSDYIDYINNLKYSINEDNSKNNYLNNILKIPLILQKNNEKENLQECIKYIKMGCKIKTFLFTYYNSNLENKCLVNYLKDYEKHMNKEIEITRENINNLIMKNENIDTLKKYLEYLLDIYNYYNISVSKKEINKYINQNINKHKIENNKEVMDYSDSCKTEGNKNNINHSDSFIDNGITDEIKINTEYIKNEFLRLKHYNILVSIREQLEKKKRKKKNNISVYEIIKLFLDKIINLKNTYEKIFNVIDTNLYRHIIFLYYFAFSLVHIKIKQKSNLNENIHNANKRDNNLLNKLNMEILRETSNSDNITDKESLKNKENYKNISNNKNAYQHEKNNKNSDGKNLDNICFTSHAFDNDNAKCFELSLENVINIEKNKKDLSENNIKREYFDIFTSKYPFLNLNSSIFNYIYYYIFFKNDKEIINFCDDENEKTEKTKEDEFQFNEKIYEKDNSENILNQKNKIINHYDFVNILYEEKDKKYKRKKQKKQKTNHEYKYFDYYTSIQVLIQNEKIKESVLDLFQYRNDNVFLSMEKENEGVVISIIFHNILNKIFIIYLYEFLQKNNIYFYQNILFFDEIEKEISNENRNIICVISEHIKNQKEYFLKNHNDFFKLNGEKRKIVEENDQKYYHEKINEKLKHTFLISYFYNIIFILKNIKYYVDKSLFYVIIYLFENSFKNVIENLIIIFLANQNIFFKSKTFHFIMEILFKIILPFTFFFLSSIFQIDVTSSTEKIFKILDNYGINI
ncbi:conserved Plasmodium protein, unknown function [Plasmodium gallinaceum]|uniref:Uncharacterized protein n=1 Tax=Plasmodium gallinaceum TaxID=5849 RepID=A0A1J1GMK8_PLAGA|nr:conserved Plasmodium protein, unknown function [Plasmodium gallinaceum]CRG93670.1 conserved Plasmodium protein, unknown function [Plasmodium gallinaceum]